MKTSSVNQFREKFYTRWSWWLLLLTFALTFFSPDRGAARNLYRLFVALPALLMLSAPIITGLKEIKSVRWFAVLSLYFLLSIFWSGEIESFDNHLLRILSVWGFVLLLYYISLYRPEMFARIDLVMVGFGLVWLLIILSDWDGLWESSHHHKMMMDVTYGVFSHPRQVGWMLAILSLLSLQRMFSKDSRFLLWIILTMVFIVALFLTQSRGGLLVFFVGVFVFFIINKGRMHRRSVALVCVGLLSVIGFFYNFYSDLFASLLTRGASGRFIIWQNWYDLWQGDVIKLFFGHGFGAVSTENMLYGRLMPHYHNFYMNTFFYVGTVGTIVFFIWVASVVRTKANKKGDYMPWYPVLFGTMTGFMTDGDKLFNYPGAFVFCFILPAFCIVFINKGLSDYEEIHAD